MQSVVFGSYDTFSNVSLDSTGTIDVSCSSSVNYSIALSSGAGTMGSRAMINGAYLLSYNLYDSAARSNVWGDGSAGSSTVSATAQTRSHTIYGRIPARQNVHVGSYTDSITVTVTY